MLPSLPHMGRSPRSWLTCAMLAALLCSNAVVVRADQMDFKRLSMDQRLGDHGIGAVKTIGQDTTGFIWIGAEYGLARYDGSRFVRYLAAPEHDSYSLLSNYINEIDFDANGVMWIATEKGLNRYRSDTDDFAQILPDHNRDGNNRVAAIDIDEADNIIMARDDGISILYADRKHVRHFPIDQDEHDNHVSVQRVFVDSNGTIWLGTKGGGAAVFDLTNEVYRFFRHQPSDPHSIISNNITAISEDNKGRLWFGAHEGGLSRLSPKQTHFSRYTHNPDNPRSISANTVRTILTDSQGATWVASDHGGLSLYDEEIEGFHTIRHQPYNPNSISSNQVRDIFEDRNGDLWVGLFPSGLDFYNRSAEQFSNHQHQPDNQHSLSHNGILSFLEDRHGILWTGTESGLNFFDRASNRFRRYQGDHNGASLLQSTTLLSLEEDKLGQLWLGTWSAGVYRISSNHTQFVQYQPLLGDPNSLSNAFVWAMETDSQGRLWLGTEGGGLNLFDAETEQFVHFKHDPNDPKSISSDFIWSLMIDSNDRLWIGTTEGVNRFDPHTRVFERAVQIEPTGMLGNDRIRSFFEDSRGRIWIGAQDNGLFIFTPQSQTVQHVGSNSMLPALYVTGFIEDLEGYIWASTTNGLAKIDPHTLTMKIFNKEHGLVSNNFNREANYLDHQGRLYFGSSDGISVFDPGTLVEDDHNFPVVVTGFNILNQPAKIGVPDSPLTKVIWETDAITLPSSSNMFSFDFSALEFSNSQSKEYAYMLQGFNHDWIQIGKENSATFTNLNPGTYLFKVRAGNNGNWSEHIPAITIKVLPSLWRTWWAYGLYIFVIAGIIFLLVNAKAKQVQLQSEREINRELKNLNRIKDSFLANTSHELRTPLNGIIGIADALVEHFGHTDKYAIEHLHVIATSGRRLATLINDILDYSKLANHNLEIAPRSIQLQPVTEAVLALLTPLTNGRPIELINALPEQPIMVLADANRLQQILINLVGNGLKYSPQGYVKVGVTLERTRAVVFVEDSGIGIAEEKRESIFEAFHQIESSYARQYGGTGLGLAITKQLVELHHGEIWVASTKPQGTTVYFTLNLSSDQAGEINDVRPAEAMINQNFAGNPLNIQKNALLPAEFKINIPRNAEDQTVLIVDDDAVNRMVLQSILKLHRYRVIEAENGHQAISLVAQNPAIDLIIMDIMMPKLTGFETCAIIREQYALHSLPIIFLTAKMKNNEDLAQCFAVGGNDYVTKPVSKFDLLPRVANHIRLAGLVKRIPL